MGKILGETMMFLDENVIANTENLAEYMSKVNTTAAHPDTVGILLCTITQTGERVYLPWGMTTSSLDTIASDLDELFILDE